MNLLDETFSALAHADKFPEDVLWCGGKSQWFTWEEFERVANVDYDNGYGGQEIAQDLVIVGKDWWLERHEYDGSERWVFKSQPVRPATHKPPGTLCSGDSYRTIEEMNNPD